MNRYVYFVILFLALGKLYSQKDNIIELSLNDAIEISLKNNPEIKTAMEESALANGKFWSEISLPQPEISLGYEYIPVNSGLDNFTEKTLGISQSFEFPVNYFLRGAKLLKEKEISENELLTDELNISSNVKRAYLHVLTKQELLLIAQDNLAIAEDFYKKANIRYNVGEGTNIERLTAKVQYIEALNNLEIQRNQLTIALAELSYAMGYGKDEKREYQLTDTLGYVRYDFTFENLVTEAYLQPILKAEELRVASVSAERTLTWLSLFPNFNLAYFRQTLDGNSDYYGVSFGMTIPLWFMFDHRGKIQQASANVSIAESNLKLTENIIYLKIKNAFTEFLNEEKQVQLYEKEILPQTEEIYRIASTSYEAGEITYIEFLQAKQTIINSRSNYIHTLLSYNLSIVTLEEAIGKRLM